MNNIGYAVIDPCGRICFGIHESEPAARINFQVRHHNMMSSVTCFDEGYKIIEITEIKFDNYKS